MKHILSALLAAAFAAACSAVPSIPLPEHPRPDFERAQWLNLNGEWEFAFSASEDPGVEFDSRITVPFPWGSKLSGIEDGGDVAWYGRDLEVPKSWKGRRVFLVVGASDYHTDAYLGGKLLGSHDGGYTPFEFELTDLLDWKSAQRLSLRVDDTYSASHLYGKQGYGNARGIWQTVYLEARGSQYIRSLHFSPDIDASCVRVDAALDAAPAPGTVLEISMPDGKTVSAPFDSASLSFDIPLADQHLWTLDDPYLYEVTASVKCDGRTVDSVDSYWGQRKIGTVQVPGKDYRYVALNNEPVYLQLCLDQSYHPDGFYTFPSDEFMRGEIELSKRLGLNGNRIHIKTEIPRKLYWADRLGLLIMADIPNYWGEPVPEARADWERTMRAQVERDFNHPSIFAWVDFNETWGLFTGPSKEAREYLPETQEWVRSMYSLTKALDPTRLVEDNSPCNNDHVATDINSWHSYNAGYNWEETIARYDGGTYPGTEFNFIGGNVAGDQPMINSECGNVWGYRRSAGDSDYTWDYHEMMNAFHRHPKVGGWLYTEHHDVINEWNGYVRFDRSAKVDGLSDFVPGMDVSDFHSHYYVTPATPVCEAVGAGSTVSVPLLSSFTTSVNPGPLTLETSLSLTDELGVRSELGSAGTFPVAWAPFSLESIGTAEFTLPERNGVYCLSYVLKNDAGAVLHRNFSLFIVRDAARCPQIAASFSPGSYTGAKWKWNSTLVLDGLKADGFGNGYFDYEVALPDTLPEFSTARLLFEASAKQLFGKDIPDGVTVDGDFMLGQGTADPCKVPNAYSMTDTRLFPSSVEVSLDGKVLGTYDLPDDPADHRGVLSWSAQPHDRMLREAGSYGYLISVDLPADAVKPGAVLHIRLASPGDGGLAIYGRDFGRYPLDPSIVLDCAPVAAEPQVIH